MKNRKISINYDDLQWLLDTLIEYYFTYGTVPSWTPNGDSIKFKQKMKAFGRVKVKGE